MKEEIHIGKLIQERLKINRCSVAWLAEQLHYDRSHTYRLLKKHFMDTELLTKISKLLDYDFFVHFSAWLHEPE
jgi:hypothetical protein